MAERLILVIAAIPVRYENLHALIRDVLTQTRVVDEIVVFLNGWRGTRIDMDYGRVRLDVSPDPRGPGVRWRYLAQRALEPDAPTTALSLDDDFRLDPTYVETTVAALEHSEAAMVAWTGHPSARRYIGLETAPHLRVLWTGGTGACAVRVSALAGLADHPLADELLGLHGDEEALLSLWLWQQQQRIVRPAGPPPIRDVPALQYAETASHKIHGPTWRARRQQIIEEYQWR